MAAKLSSHYFILLVLISAIGSLNALNILGIFPHPGKSHNDVFQPLMKGLATKGHNVTVLSFYPLESPTKNYRDVSLKSTVDPWLEVINVNDIMSGNVKYEQWLGGIFLIKYASKLTCEKVLTSKVVQDFVNSNKDHYDVLIIEYFNTDCFLSLNAKFKAPVVGFSSCTMMPWASARFGNPTHPGYIPNLFMPFSDKQTFLERVENTAVTLFHIFCYKFYMSAQDEPYAKQYLGKQNKMEDLTYNSSLLLVNTHFSLNLPKPFVPNVIEVGGIHIGNKKPLPKNIEKWISESPEGVIYFSLGSMIKGHTLPKDKKDAFMKAFKRLPQRVLWKWEDEKMEGKPDNVMIQKWMPQFDILSHPNVKGFISHGGLLGTTEAVHCGVPVIVMPQFGDQYNNARALEASGGGVILQLSQVTEEKVYNALKKILDPKFNKQAKELSKRFRDRPLSPLDTAIYWVEYVARHKGAPHMRTAAVGMPWYQYFLLDVIAFLLLVLATITYLSYVIIKFIVSKVFLNKSTKKVKSS